MAETVYANEDGHVMSEKVQTLAASIYQEFERMIKSYDENVVKELMPLVVGVLETLDFSLQEKQENDVEIELLREDNEQLVTQYEREKQLRKTSEQKCLTLEDAIEDESRVLQNKVDGLESQIRMHELKAKNASDHVARLEEKEENSKKEYNKLHERYTELFKTHMDYMERTKMVMGVDRGDTGITPRQKAQNFQLPNLRPINQSGNIFGNGETPTIGDVTPDTPYRSTPGGRRESNTNLKTELLKSPEVDNKPRRDANRNPMTSTGIGSSSISTSERSTSKEDLHKLVRATIDGYYSENQNSSQASNTEGLKTNTDITTANSRVTDTNNDTTRDSVTGTTTVSSRTGVSESSQTRVQDNIDEEVQTSLEISMKEDKKKLMVFNSMLEGNDEFEESIGVVDRKIKVKQAQKDKSELEIEEDDDMAGDESKNMSIYDELAYEDSSAIGEIDDGVDITAVDSDTDSHVSDSFFGMGKEVENLIAENTELIETKNALNIVKDDLIAQLDELNSEQELLKEQVQSMETVKSRLKLRVSELEDELKKTKEELSQKGAQNNPGDEEDDVPVSMRKRFTRVEMARVLMERNQYKERLMELQEAVRWTEMIRASKEHPDLQPKKKSSIWNFFANLFTSSNKPSKRPLPSATVRYKAPTTEVHPLGDPNKKKREKYAGKSKAYDFMEDDGVSDKSRKERERERREQYKQVRAHVKKDDGRLQAYGWSLPAKLTTIPTHQSSQNKPQVPVPVPVYCRPLLEKEHGMKMWCAAGVTLSGGRTQDGGSVIGASVFYTNPPEDTEKPTNDLEKLSSELDEHKKALVSDDDQMSSLVWICTTAQATSRVTVIDANNPGEILECFHVTSSHILCIASVPGAKENDFPVDEEFLNIGESTQSESSSQSQMSKNSSSASLTSENSGSTDATGIGGVTFVQCATGSSRASNAATPVGSPATPTVKELSPEARTSITQVTEAVQNMTADTLRDEFSVDPSLSAEEDDENNAADPLGASNTDTIKTTVIRAVGSPVHSNESSPARTLISSESRRLSEPTELVKDGVNAVANKDSDFMMVQVKKMSSILPTMWLGSQSGSLYVHSAGAQWKICLHSVKLKDSVLSIVHVRGRVLVALADGTVAVFHRDKEGQWDLKNYHLLDLGRPHHSIRCMVVVANKHVWCGYKNTIHIVNPATLKVEKSFDAHPRKESQVRQMTWVGDGVWVSIRLDSTLRLYHAYTYQHLQDVDIEPYVSKMLGTGKLGFSFVRITSLAISCNRLWIGTGNGVVISVPLSEHNKHPVTTGSGGSSRPGGVIRVYSDAKGERVTPGSFIPYCSMAQAQLSFHGHRDAVKFFVAVPGVGAQGLGTIKQLPKTESSNSLKKTMLVMSGGEGYIDFRIGDGDEDEESLENPTELQSATISRGERSHLIVWEVACPE